MNNETSILKTKEEQIKAEKSYLGKDMDDLTVEELHQLNEDEINYDCANFSIGIVFSRKFKAYMEEKNKQQPDQSILDSLKNELTKLRHEERYLYNKSREEIKEIRCYYSKILRDKV